MRMIIAGGGTGGHLFPGVALAEELLSLHNENQVLFVGTERGLEAKIIPELGFNLELIDVQGIKGKGLSSRLLAMSRLPSAVSNSVQILRNFKPDVAIGVGGYASGPMIFAAWLMRIPSVILEQNTVPGVTNRILGRFVHRVFAMFEESRRYFPSDKVNVLGNPVRRQFLTAFNGVAPREIHLPDAITVDRPFKVLVLGGSQGAHNLNLRMLEAIERLHTQLPIQMVHQTGEKDEGLVRHAYEKMGVSAEVRAFINDMAPRYADADLVVCRAGATTLAELMIAGCPSILVPFPHATDNHQELNGRAMVETGAALMLPERELNGEVLANRILALAKSPQRRKVMSQAASELGDPLAAQNILKACSEELVQGIKYGS